MCFIFNEWKIFLDSEFIEEIEGFHFEENFARKTFLLTKKSSAHLSCHLTPAELMRRWFWL